MIETDLDTLRRFKVSSDPALELKLNNKAQTMISDDRIQQM